MTDKVLQSSSRSGFNLEGLDLLEDVMTVLPLDYRISVSNHLLSDDPCFGGDLSCLFLLLDCVAKDGCIEDFLIWLVFHVVGKFIVGWLAEFFSEEV